jgi:catechol 2,3-dioxygenase-like lactoylglutathione lyase family enzyme
MIDHVTFLVSDYQRSREFYLAALAPLGYRLVMELTQAAIPELPVSHFCGIGPGKPVFWLRPTDGPIGATHVAFRSPDHASVDAFHRAALAAGGRDHGAPGLRTEYHPSYYGAFVLDPDGHNVEAVCHTPV